MTELPGSIARVVELLSKMPGVTSVVLGGSRAQGAFDADSDWDLGVYYRGEIELSALRALGEVHPPGRWGRLMNGGAWLDVDGIAVDVILRDVEVVEQWTARAEAGEFEVDGLLGYLAGLPTYSLAAERSFARVLTGEAPRAIAFPAALASGGEARWRFCSEFSIEQAAARAKRGDAIGAAGHVARAIVEEAHARLCARRAWALNEKRIVEQAGLSAMQREFAAMPREASALVAWVEQIGAQRAAATPPRSQL